MRYIIAKSDISQLNEIMKKYVKIHNKKYYLYQIRCALKDDQYLTCESMLNLEYTRYPNIFIEIQPCSSQVFEMRITFISSHRCMTFDYYKK